MTDPPDADDRIIRVGDAGDAVVDVQRRLMRVGPAGARGFVCDGRFGQDTFEAVRHFQRARGLAADGVVGPETWRALTEAGWRLGDRLLWQTSRLQRGDDVRELQDRLNRLGFDAGQEDGIYGPLARDAVEEFQRNVGLAVDGKAGPETVEALRRLHRGHQSGGLAVRARQHETLRRLEDQGIVGTRVLVDAARGGVDRGRQGPGGTWESDLTWCIASRVAGRLAARGATVIHSRGPGTGPLPSVRSRQANELGVDLVLSIGVNAHASPAARGAATYYFGAPHVVSEPGLQLARRVQEALVDDGWTPDCGTHPMTWALLRETRMPTVVVEPGFLSSPEDERALTDAGRQDRLAGALARAVERFLGATAQPASTIGSEPAAVPRDGSR